MTKRVAANSRVASLAGWFDDGGVPMPFGEGPFGGKGDMPTYSPRLGTASRGSMVPAIETGSSPARARNILALGRRLVREEVHCDQASTVELESQALLQTPAFQTPATIFRSLIRRSRTGKGAGSGSRTANAPFTKTAAIPSACA
jgi:hypothetical protein